MSGMFYLPSEVARRGRTKNALISLLKWQSHHAHFRNFID